MSAGVAVIGAGAVGLACARRLQRDGREVTLFDPAPASDRSAAWGSAGILTPDMLAPLATPEMLSSLPKMLLRSDSPLVLRWAHAPRALPWLTRFVWNARPSRAEHNGRALATLAARAIPAWHALLDAEDASRLLREGGWFMAFESRAGLRAARRGIERRRRHGAPAEMLDGPDLRARIPQLGDHVVGGVWFPATQVCLDPGALLARLAEQVQARGGAIREEPAVALLPGERAVGVQTPAGRSDFERVVVCAGAHSRALAHTLGDDFPLDTERGYHVMLPSGPGPDLPVMSGEHRFVTTTMSGGVRLTGTTELAGLVRPADPRRFALLRRQAARLFPGLDTGGGSEWMGFRPSLPDSLPIIGDSPRSPRVTYALGHQHLGLTLAAVTAEMVADRFAGRPPSVAPEPFRVERFAGS